LASLSLYHASSGLFGVVSYGQRDNNDTGFDNIANGVGSDNATNWYGKLGWRKNFTGMGETAFYGEYTQSDNVSSVFDPDSQTFIGTEGTQWGVGVGQDIDAVGGTLYLGYRHSEADIFGFDAEAQDQILGGMVLPF
jgi:hypothetical protein